MLALYNHPANQPGQFTIPLSHLFHASRLGNLTAGTTKLWDQPEEERRVGHCSVYWRQISNYPHKIFHAKGLACLWFIDSSLTAMGTDWQCQSLVERPSLHMVRGIKQDTFMQWEGHEEAQPACPLMPAHGSHVYVRHYQCAFLSSKMCACILCKHVPVCI